jgi:hypothetical protein
MMIVGIIANLIDWWGNCHEGGKPPDIVGCKDQRIKR